ncbi:hypothetical protein [Streptomyces sp. NPDC003717]|uniref:hypothetical protein n=1 Tax=Streptomyces sp. NPDC003717 TaxID=3154276 RepID=UPI0033ACFB65
MGSRRLHGFSGAAVALVLSVSTAMLLGRSWNACDVGVNNAANSGFLLWLFIPVLGAALLLTWVAAGALLGNRPLLHALTLTVTLLAVTWCAISLFWDGTPGPLCPRGVPPWWPGFVPVPGW